MPSIVEVAERIRRIAMETHSADQTVAAYRAGVNEWKSNGACREGLRGAQTHLQARLFLVLEDLRHDPDALTAADEAVQALHLDLTETQRVSPAA